MNSKFIFTLCLLAIAKAQDGYSQDQPINQLRFDVSAQEYSEDDNSSDGGEIPGEAGRDYPVYSEVPQTSFSCENQQFPGYYADPEAQCQVFYVCQKGGKSDSFLCPNGTVFNQEYLVCDWWYNFECGSAESLYSVNEQVVIAMEEADARLAQQGYSAVQSGNHDSSESYGATSINGNDNGNGNGHYKENGNGKHSINGNRHNGDSQFSNGNRNELSPKSEYGIPASAPQGISNGRYSNSAEGNGRGAYENGNGNGQKNGFHGITNGNGQYQNDNGNGNGIGAHENGNGQKNGFHGNTNRNGQYQNGNGNSNGIGAQENGNGQKNGFHRITNGNGQYQNGNANGIGAHENGNEERNGFKGIANGNRNRQYQKGNGKGDHKNGNGQKKGFNDITYGNSQYQNGNGNRALENPNINENVQFSNGDANREVLSSKYGVPVSAAQGNSNEHYNKNGVNRNGNGNGQTKNDNLKGNGNGARENGNGGGFNGEAHFSNGNKNGNGVSPKPEYGVPKFAPQRISNEHNNNGNRAHENANGNGFHDIASENRNSQYKNGNEINRVNGRVNGDLIPSLENNFSKGVTFHVQGTSTPESGVFPPSGNHINDEGISVEAGIVNGDSFNGSGPSVQGNGREPERSYLPAL